MTGRPILLAMGIVAAASTGQAQKTEAPFTTAYPVIFAPGVISGGAHEAAPAFTPDGRTLYFQRSTPAASTILVSHQHGNGWSAPRVAAFSGEWNDMEPALAPDGSFLIFVSSRPSAPGLPQLDAHFGGKVAKGQGGNLWRTDRTKNGWSPPVRLDPSINSSSDIFAPSVARDGSIYFMRPDSASSRFRLFRSQHTAEGYSAPEPLPFSTGATTDVDPAVDPDERFLVFASSRRPAAGMDLFLVERQGRGWSEPRLLSRASSPGSDAEPRLSPDLRTLFFSSERISPTRFPRDRATAEREVREAAEWNNGQYNIWAMPFTRANQRPFEVDRPNPAASKKR